MRKIKRACLDADPLDKVTPEILLDFGLSPPPARTCPTPRKSSPSLWRAANTCTSSPRLPAALQRRGRLLQSGRKRPRNPQRTDAKQTRPGRYSPSRTPSWARRSPSRSAGRTRKAASGRRPRYVIA
jgi:hypothetical protein